MPTKPIGIRIPEDVYVWLKEKSEIEHRNLSNTIISILMDAKECEQNGQCKSH